ncbi:hypothetical protein BC936DRAFT_143085 [Jimgerdemannia flammicorona]|uniref:DUF1479 domain protein n=1 Tax=Jimgerdemannia flammicorona TaxID=994334 RepID=A0A432ZZV5_9FUNG|nr:hypothetical protein BC936DRAFT_143085 [Jimgerdemannia flammicorona]
MVPTPLHIKHTMFAQPPHAAKAAGDISSAFVQLGSTAEPLPPRFAALKQSISPRDPAILALAWTRLLAQLERETAEIEREGPNIVPQVDFAAIRANGGRFPDAVAAQIRKRGCVVIRGVVSEEQALGWKEDTKKYIARNRNRLIGFPAQDPQVWEVYWSPAQLAARENPNLNVTTGALNALWWAEEETLVDLERSVTYCDRLRIRKPGDTSFALGEHVDGGSLERWEDDEYRKCYTKILEGDWEAFDMWDATHRVNARMDLYNGAGGCSMFRTFQGWLSLSNAGPGRGTLRLCPLIRETVAYMMMRPLLADLASVSDMAGAWPARVQDLSREYHEHIIRAMVSVPDVRPGDCVFWSCDTVHAVEGVAGGTEDASVFYIPAAPLCELNANYLRKQRDEFEKGRTPPDFPGNHCEALIEERGKPGNLTRLGRTLMGFEHVEISEGMGKGQREAVRRFNVILGLRGA